LLRIASTTSHSGALASKETTKGAFFGVVGIGSQGQLPCPTAF
jgi:hypothetical protein